MKKKTIAKKKTAEKPSKKAVAEPVGIKAGAAAAGKDEEAPQDLDTILKGMSGGDGVKRVSQWAAVQCPYCGENFEVHFDSVEDGHSVEEDCAVCCKTILLSVSVEEDDVHVSSYRA